MNEEVEAIYILTKKTKIDRQGCWIWTGHKNRGGYGVTYFQKRTITAHRLSYLLFNGPLEYGLVICHKCHVPSCINPDHLRQGTSGSNVIESLPYSPERAETFDKLTQIEIPQVPVPKRPRNRKSRYWDLARKIRHPELDIEITGV